MDAEQPKIEIVEGVADEHLDDMFRVAYGAFSDKFRIGFRNVDDLSRLFRDKLNRSSCYTAVVDGGLVGVLAVHTSDGELFHLSLSAALTRFSPLRAIRILLNLLLFANRVKPDELYLDALAVDESMRDRGVGTALIARAEEAAAAAGRRIASLDVIGDNEGAIRLYERLGYRVVKVERGFFVWLATRSSEVRRMEKSLTDTSPGDGSEKRP